MQPLAHGFRAAVRCLFQHLQANDINKKHFQDATCARTQGIAPPLSAYNYSKTPAELQAHELGISSNPNFTPYFRIVLRAALVLQCCRTLSRQRLSTAASAPRIRKTQGEIASHSRLLWDFHSLQFPENMQLEFFSLRRLKRTNRNLFLPIVLRRKDDDAFSFLISEGK